MSAGLNVSPAQLSRSYHDLSYSKTFDVDMGRLFPILHDECVPGDVWSIGAEFVVRANPLMAPLLHRLDVKVDYFFVPYRILMGRVIDHPEEGEWEDFITGGKDGKSTVTLPRWPAIVSRGKGTLWDAFGFPITANPPAVMPLDFPQRAYKLIWNEYYRDQDLHDEVDITKDDYNANYGWLFASAWEKDYFTSARPFQQKGDPMAFPVSLSASLKPSGGVPVFGYPNGDVSQLAVTGPQLLGLGVQRGIQGANGADLGPGATLGVSAVDLANVPINFTNTSTFDVADLRFIVQAQRWMERNARAGSRYTEFLKAHFGVYPNDARLQRPEYIGGIRSPIIFSEVLQTSETTSNSPQGNLSGHGITFDNEHVGKYRVEEFGIVMGIFRIVPKPVYMQGINRQWLRQTRFDFYMPEFAHLSEQEVLSMELFVDGSADDTSVFGFQGRYNELRFKQNLICGELRDTLKFWHAARIFENRPFLNYEFVRLDDDAIDSSGGNSQFGHFRKDIFQVPSESGFIVSFGNRLDVMRPIPVDPEPGMIDHI